MGLFGRRQADGVPRPSARRIPALNPSYYEGIEHAIRENGGSDSLADVADGIANAVENVADRLFDSLGESHTARRFASQFEGRAKGDLDIADQMIDWLVSWDAGCQDLLETTLRRLSEVLAKPA